MSTAMATIYQLDRALVRVSGEGAGAFLNNLLTQTVDPAPSPTYAALLTPQGKIIADMMVWRDGPDFLLELDAAHGEDMTRRLNMYKLRAPVTISADASVCVLWSSEPFDAAAPDPRLPALGWRKLVSSELARTHADADAAFEAHRINAGAPDLAQDAGTDEVFALEALLEEFNGVDFQKGCFVGQENVSRMKRRATTRKKFCPIIFEGPAPDYGTPIRGGEADIGSVRSGAPGRAIALLRLDRALAAIKAGAVLTADGREVSLDPPPWLIPPQSDEASN
jgi:tRNA-modifying protein YgfZ